MTAPKQLTPEQAAEAQAAANLKRRIKRLWKGDLTLEEIREETGMPVEEFLALAAGMGLVDRPEPDVYIPTADQIRMDTAAIRAAWSKSELESRRCITSRATID
jgi:hypothetical protein